MASPTKTAYSSTSVAAAMSPLARASTKPSTTAISFSVLGHENFDVFITAAVRLLPATLSLATPREPSAQINGHSCCYDAGSGLAAGAGVRGKTGVVEAEGSRGRSGRVPRRRNPSNSPYEETESLAMVFECLVEACTECLENGAW